MQRFIIIGIVVLVFLSFMVTYTVRFNEAAVVSMIGRADESSVRRDAGLGFKLPFIQRVTTYDTRARLVESAPETQSTLDSKQLVVTSYVAWSVEDPLKFYKSFSGAGDSARDHYREAENSIKSKLRSSLGEVSAFRLTDLLAADERGSRLPELEARMLAMLQRPGGGDQAGAALADYGIKAHAVGLSSIVFPQENTKNVVARMNENRKKVAQEITNQGTSQANAIRSRAENDAKRILAFADRMANELRSRGQAEVASYIQQMSANPELAVFLKNMKMYREVYGRQTTLVLPTSMPGFELLGPDAPSTFRQGTVPIPDFERLFQNGTSHRPTPRDPVERAVPVAGTQEPTR
ncbi:MAG: hypothetical protein KF699_06725 [Phycisphaeraceae bacterium]|nr:hypothetical protein [Phycisphaeraceae bacterium]MBX3407240.1 hypothetical protein [Phycisphaeraceae bacterium]